MTPEAEEYGLFETILVRDGAALLAEAHADRLRLSAAMLGLPSPGRERFLDELRLAIDAARPHEQAARVTWTRSGSNWVLRVSLFDIAEVTLSRRIGASVTLLDRALRRTNPQHKLTREYAICTESLQHARARGFNEAIFVGDSGNVLEGTSTNVFAVEGKQLVTPAVGEGILPGVMRQWVVDRAPQAGFTVREAPVRASDLESGSFLTGSLTTIAPILSVDGKKCAVADGVVDKLRELFLSA